MMRRAWPAVSAVCVGVGGFLGSWYERTKQEPPTDNIVHSKLTFFTHAATGKQDNPSTTPKQVQPIQNRANEIMKFGLPNDGQFQMHDNFAISYDRRLRNAKWVFECLTKEEVKYNDAVARTECQFEPDQSLHPYFRATNEDYFRSGYDKGHLAAAANHRRSDGVMQQTFILSNICPQVGDGFNRGIWNNLEIYVRSLTKVYSKVYVCTGPLYLPHVEANQRQYVKYEVIGNNFVAVPTHFFKVVLGETRELTYHLKAFIVPNAAIPDGTPLEKFLVPLNTIERSAGFLLFERLPRNSLRSTKAPIRWKQ